jgi:hypothetical protein
VNLHFRNPNCESQAQHKRNRLRRLLITAGILALASTARASDDWQYWNQLVFKHELNDRLALDIASLQKWRDDVSDFFLYYVSIVPTVSLTKNLSLGAGYRCERREEDEQWTTENRFLAPLTATWTGKPWIFQLPNQLEYRELQSEQDRWRIRERFTLKWPVRVGQFALIPFASEEVFYDFTAEQINQNRVAAGLSVPWRKHMTLTIFYMTKSERDGDWSTAKVLGTEAAVKF